MKTGQTIGLLTLGVALLSTGSWAQTTPAGSTTPTGTATTTTYPQGAVAPDSTPAGGSSRSQRRTSKRRRSGTSTPTSQGEAQYRQSSSANATSINNSNSTNYNSNNVTNAPTGAGSNPSATGTTTGNPSTSSGSSSSSGGSTTPPNDGNLSGTNSGGASDNSGATKTATAAAVTGARSAAEPAVTAGSTERNTSIHDFVASSPNYTTLQNALQSAGLDDALKSEGPYTVFAPSNAAFKKLPAPVQGGLLEGRNRDALRQLLSYHVVKGAVDAAELNRQIKAGNGKAQLQTLAGGTLIAQAGSDGRVTLTDAKGGTAYVEAADNQQSNGVVHGITAVLSPQTGTAAFR